MKTAREHNWRVGVVRLPSEPLPQTMQPGDVGHYRFTAKVITRNARGAAVIKRELEKIGFNVVDCLPIASHLKKRSYVAPNRAAKKS